MREERLGEILVSCLGHDAEAAAEKLERSVLELRSEPPRDDLAIMVVRVSLARLA
jgi:hypothetical protein